MKKQSKVPDKKDKSKKITSREKEISLKKIARISDIPAILYWQEQH
jgi:hypothetical protein